MLLSVLSLAATTHAQDQEYADALASGRDAFTERFRTAFDAHTIGDAAAAVEIGADIARALVPWCAVPNPDKFLCGPPAYQPRDCSSFTVTDANRDWCSHGDWHVVAKAAVNELAACSTGPELRACVQAALDLASERSGIPRAPAREPEPMGAPTEIPECALLQPIYTIGRETFTAGLATAVRPDDQHVVVLSVGMPNDLPPHKAYKKVSRVELRDARTDAMCGDALRFLPVAYTEPLVPLGMHGLLPADGHRLQPLPLARRQVDFRDPLLVPVVSGPQVEAWAVQVHLVRLDAWAPDRADKIDGGLPLLNARGEVAGIVLGHMTAQVVAASPVPALWHKIERSFAADDPLTDTPLLPHPYPPTPEDYNQRFAEAGKFIDAHLQVRALPTPPVRPPSVVDALLPLLEARGWGDVPRADDGPDPLVRVEPKPQKVRGAQLLGNCLAMVQIEPDGTPSRVEVEGCDERLAESAREAIAQWRWVPIPAAIRITVLVKFV